jgi:transcriptional regulator with XRE-family HTH domain
MASGDQPAVARRRVRMALREAREKKELTQGQVAEAMEWSLSKVMRIESGEVTIAPNDLRFLLTHLGIADRVRIDELLQDAKTSRRRQMWWDELRFREHTTPALRQLIQYEAESAAIRHFHWTLIPGLLQTPAYARATLESFGGLLSQEDIEVRLEMRLRRRRELLARKPRPNVCLLLDESVLYRVWGGPKVMGEQLFDLLGLMRGKRVLTRVLPFTLHAPVPLLGPFDILDLGGGDAVVYTETNTTDEMIDDPAKVEFHRVMFEQLWVAAYDDATSLRLIEERVDSLTTHSSEPPG